MAAPNRTIAALEAAAECLALVEDVGHGAHPHNVEVARKLVREAISGANTDVDDMFDEWLQSEEGQRCLVSPVGAWGTAEMRQRTRLRLAWRAASCRSAAKEGKQSLPPISDMWGGWLKVGGEDVIQRMRDDGKFELSPMPACYLKQAFGAGVLMERQGARLTQSADEKGKRAFCPYCSGSGESPFVPRPDLFQASGPPNAESCHTRREPTTDCNGND